MPASTYELEPLFAVRFSGEPHEVLERLATPEVSVLAREVIAVESALAAAVKAAVAAVKELSLPPRVDNRIVRALWARRSVADEPVAGEPAVVAYTEQLAARDRARARLEQQLVRDDEAASARLWQEAARILPEFLALQADTEFDQWSRFFAAGAPAQRRTAERDRERHLAAYLQRLSAKNDTFSRFGPSGWGRVDPAARGLRIAPQPGIARRHVQIERRVVKAIAAALNHDPEVRPEVAPRLHPNGRFDGDMFVRHDTGAEIHLAPGERELAQHCRGDAPAHALGELAALATLAERGVVIWEVELVAMDATPMLTLVADVRAWRDGEARRRWLPIVEQIAGIAEAFVHELGPAPRVRLTEQLRTRITELGAALPERGRKLYEATNPLVEECVRDLGFVVGGDLAAELNAHAEPWYDLFRDTFSLASSYAYRRLAELYAQAPRAGGKVTLAGFLPFCEQHGVVLRGSGLPKLASAAFADVRTAFAAALAGRDPAEREWTLSADDCYAVRRRLQFPFVHELTAPSADLQLAARSPEAVARGEYTWVVSELHHCFVILQNAFMWACPDPAQMGEIGRRACADRPILLHEHALFDAPVHAAHEGYLNVLPAAAYVAADRAKPGWKVTAPSDAEVILVEANHDVRVRAPEGSDLGSLVRNPKLSMGFHPFLPLELAPHTPRLKLGPVVVQRESWHISKEELGLQKVDGKLPDVIIAIERLRAARQLPRWIYMRPSPQALGAVEHMGRDKDIKPMYVDLESSLFVEIFARRLFKYGTLHVVEMLPSPDEQPWREADGSRSFELRTILAQRQ